VLVLLLAPDHPATGMETSAQTNPQG